MKKWKKLLFEIKKLQKKKRNGKIVPKELNIEKEKAKEYAQQYREKK